MESDLNDLKVEHEGLEIDLKLEIDGLNQAGLRMSQETLKTLERLDADIVELDGRVNNRKVETRKARSDIDHLMARLDTLEGKNTLLEERVRDQDELVQGLKNQVSLLEGRVCRCNEEGSRGRPIVIDEVDDLEYVSDSEPERFHDASMEPAVLDDGVLRPITPSDSEKENEGVVVASCCSASRRRFELASVDSTPATTPPPENASPIPIPAMRT